MSIAGAGGAGGGSGGGWGGFDSGGGGGGPSGAAGGGSAGASLHYSQLRGLSDHASSFRPWVNVSMASSGGIHLQSPGGLPRKPLVISGDDDVEVDLGDDVLDDDDDTVSLDEITDVATEDDDN